MPKFIDLTGHQFGRLTVIERVGTRNHHPLWFCECECGKSVCVTTSSLRSGASRSCGCLRNDTNSDRLTKHGGKGERLYKVWKSMKTRCFNPKATQYSDYGGRGITVCDEWAENYGAFREWALANGYDANAPRGVFTVDRIDVNSNYCPENCRLVDMKFQNNNKRSKGAR